MWRCLINIFSAVVIDHLELVISSIVYVGAVEIYSEVYYVPVIASGTGLVLYIFESITVIYIQ